MSETQAASAATVRPVTEGCQMSHRRLRVSRTLVT